VRPFTKGRAAIGGAYRVGSGGFKPDLTVSYTGLAYGMARLPTRCTHIGSRVRIPLGADRGGWCMSGRGREPDLTVGVGSSPDVPARERAR
jgi:hypothetical protein